MQPEQSVLPGFAGELYRWPEPAVLPTTCGWNPTVVYHLVQDDAALGAMVRTLQEADFFTWDTETSGLKPELGDQVVGHCFTARTGERELTGWYVPIRHIGEVNRHEPQLDPQVVSETLQPLFASGGEIATHHGKFDAKMARADGIEIGRPYSDVSIEALIANENERSFALKALMAKYGSPDARKAEDEVDSFGRKDASKLGLPFKDAANRLGLDGLPEKTYMQRYGYARVPIRLLGRYGILDTVYTWWLSRVRYPNVRRYFYEVWEREHVLSRFLMEMEWRGLRADEACIRDTHERTKEAVRHWLGELRRLAPEHVGPEFTASDPELRDLLYSKCNMKPPKFTKKGGQPSVDKEARKLLEKQYPRYSELFRALNEYAVVQKLHTTYAGNYLRFYSPRTKSIHPSYNQMERRKEGGVPVTGRMSSSDPNNQNVSSETLHLWDCYCPQCLKESMEEASEKGTRPEKTEAMAVQRAEQGLRVENTVSIRRYFVVPEGYIRIYIDFSQIELRVLAWFCQDPNLIYAYQNDLDVHQMVAIQLAIARKIAKQVNFGNSYGMSKFGLALRMPGYYDDPEYTREQAQQVLDAYFAKYKGILTFQRSFAAFMRRNGNMFVNPFGRPRRIPEISATGSEKWRRKRAERQMMSSIISGTSADLMKEAMRRAWPIASEFGGHTVQTIHDELVFDLPRKPGWARTVVALNEAMSTWPMFSEAGPGGRGEGVPIKTNVELSTTNWEDKREIALHDDGTFSWAA